MSVPMAVLRAAQIKPAGLAIADGALRLTWAETAGRMRRLAGGLSALGLGPGDRLAILAANVPAHVEITYAATLAGIVIVPINTRLAVPEIADILTRSGAAALAFDRRLSAPARQAAERAGLGCRIALDLDPSARLPGERAFETLLDAPAHDGAPPSEDALFGIYFTGGTTGRPKGVELTHGVFHVSTLDILAEVGFTTESRYLHAAPFFHLADSGLGHALTYAAGTHCFLPEPSGAAMLEAIGTEGVTSLMTVPTGYVDLLGRLPAGESLPQIRNVVYGAAPISTALLERMLAAFPNARFCQFYGQTEVCGACTALPAEWHFPGSPKLSSAGRATLSALIRIVDEEGREQPPGTPGEITVGGPIHMRGYRDEPALTAATIRDGWLFTGDVGVMDADGFVTVIDRIKDMIVTGGENVFCIEVENALMSHPGIALAAVIGLPHPRWGEAVHAVVVLAAGATLSQEEVIAHARDRIAAFKCPKSVSFAESLPLSGVGKVRKDTLRKALIEG